LIKKVENILKST